MGDLIDVIHEVDEGWLYGTIVGGDRSGIFPRTYTKFTKLTRPIEKNLKLKTSHSRLASRANSVQSLDSQRQSQLNLAENAVQRELMNRQPQSLNVVNCSICNCSDFKPHAFKPGQCTTCFHSH